MNRENPSKKLKVDDIITKLILEKEIALNLTEEVVKDIAFSLKPKFPILANQNAVTYLTVFTNAYNRISYKLKTAHAKKEALQNKSAPSSLRYSNKSIDFISYKLYSNQIQQLILSPLQNKSSLLRYSTNHFNLSPFDIKNRSIHNTVIIHGPKGVGKRTLITFISKKFQKKQIFEYNLLTLLETIKQIRKTDPANLSKKIHDFMLFPEIRDSFIIIKIQHEIKSFKEFQTECIILGGILNECTHENFFFVVCESIDSIPQSFIHETNSKNCAIKIENLKENLDKYELSLLYYSMFFNDTERYRLEKSSKTYLKNELPDLTKNFSNNDIYLLFKRAFLNSFDRKSQINLNCNLMSEDLTIALRESSSILKREVNKPIDVKLSDIGGLEKVKEMLELDILFYMKNYKKFKGFRANSGIILCGPPGCGKTMIANAIANESKASFINCKGPELVNKYLGESERELRKIFENARSNAPCIVFFDEIDSLCCKRDSNDSEASRRLVNQFLTELDSLNRTDKEPVFVIGATNREKDLDKAIVRQGRLGKKIDISLPDINERKRIFEVCSKRYNIDENIIVDDIVKDENMKGWSGADINSLINQSFLLSLYRSEKDAKENEEREVNGEKEGIILIEDLEQAKELINKSKL